MLRGASLSCQDRGVQPLPLRALLLTLAATSLAAFSPPVDAFIVDYASTPGAVPADDTYSGNSYITPERFPCPDNFKCASVMSQSRAHSEHDALQHVDMVVPSTSKTWLR